MNKLSAIILTGGESSRMGEPKALLKIGSKTFIAKIYQNLLACNFPEILIITGKDSDLIKSENRGMKARFVKNEEYHLGQLSSIQKGIKNVSSDSAGIFLCLVDMPLVTGKTMKILVDAWYEHQDHIIIPQYQGRGGHPVIFPRNFFNEIMEAPLDKGARVVVYNNPDKVTRVPVNDYGVRKDFDYPEDLTELDI